MQWRIKKTGLLTITALLFILPSTASAADQIVYVADDANIDAVVRSVGARADFTFTHVANGFVADLNASQIRRLQADSRVVTMAPDQAFTLMPFKRAPFKRAPFKRAPFKRAPFKRAPFKRADFNSPYYNQVASNAASRIGATTLALPNVNADIAILDSGIDYLHPDLNIARATSCVRGEGAYDYDGHGTMVAGLAAAKDNRIGIRGVAPGARIWSIKVADINGTVMESSALCGLEQVAANASRIDVANMSWAGEGTPTGNSCADVVAPSPTRTRSWRNLNLRFRHRFPWRSYNSTTAANTNSNTVDPASIDAIEALICQINSSGVTLVAAAGNDADDASKYLPAAWPQVMAVSSFADTDGMPGSQGPAGCLSEDPDDTFSSFSNDGAAIAISAPGECLITTDTYGDYAIGSGTSYAAGVVSGAVALAANTRLDHRPAEIRASIQAAAESGPIPGDLDDIPEGILHVPYL